MFHDTSNLFPLDTLLRMHGWQISGRPKSGEAEWEKDGVIMPQSEAQKCLPAVLVQSAIANDFEAWCAVRGLSV